MIKCTISSPLETTAYDNLRGITLPAVHGQMEILPGHAESFMLLQKGDVILHYADSEDKVVKIAGSGACYAKDDAIVIFI